MLSFRCLGCQIIAGYLLADFVWRFVRQRLEWSFAVVESYVMVYCPDELRWAFVFIDIEIFILDTAEVAFRYNIIQSLTFAIHGNLHAMVFQKLDVLRIREVTPLIGVDDFWLSLA